MSYVIHLYRTFYNPFTGFEHEKSAPCVHDLRGQVQCGCVNGVRHLHGVDFYFDPAIQI